MRQLTFVAGVILEIVHRQPVELGAADIGGDGVEQIVPAAVRLEIGRRRTVRTFRRLAPAARKTPPAPRANSSCSPGGKPTGSARRAHGGMLLSMVRPCASATFTHGLRSAECSQPQPRSIALPARILDAVGAAAEPRPRLDDQAIDGRHAEPPPSRDAGRAAADDRNLGVAIGHSANPRLTI